jgi:ribosomal protein L22
MSPEKPTDEQAEGEAPARGGEKSKPAAAKKQATAKSSDAAKPAVRKPAVKKPAAKPAVAADAEEGAVAEKKPARARRAPAKRDQPVAEKESAEKPSAKKPASEKPAAGKPPARKEPVAEKASDIESASADTAKPAGGARRAAQAASPVRRKVVRAQARYVRTSARKARMVCGHLRGKSIEEARAILAFTPREVARDWSKLLESAVANAENNHEGPTIKRFRPRAQGRATPIRKRTSHLTITLTPKP